MPAGYHFFGKVEIIGQIKERCTYKNWPHFPLDQLRDFEVSCKRGTGGKDKAGQGWVNCLSSSCPSLAS